MVVLVFSFSLSQLPKPVIISTTTSILKRKHLFQTLIIQYQYFYGDEEANSLFSRKRKRIYFLIKLNDKQLSALI